MVDFKDEILEDEPKYRLRDENGNIILDNVTLEMITKVVQEPTPLNRDSFNKLQNNIESIKNCVGAFNVPEYLSYDTNNHLVLKNEIPEYFTGLRVFIDIPVEYETIDGDLIPAFTSDSDDFDGLKIGTSDQINDEFKALDGDADTYAEKPDGQLNSASFSITSSNTKYYPLKARIKYLASSKNTTFNFGLYNNGWVERKAYTTADYYVWYEQELEFSGDTPLYGSSVLLITTAASGSSIIWRIAELQITQYKVEKVNSSLYSYININGLGEKLINQKLEMGKKYELVYDGTAFNATEVA